MNQSLTNQELFVTNKIQRWLVNVTHQLLEFDFLLQYFSHQLGAALLCSAAVHHGYFRRFLFSLVASKTKKTPTTGLFKQILLVQFFC